MAGRKKGPGLNQSGAEWQPSDKEGRKTTHCSYKQGGEEWAAGSRSLCVAALGQFKQGEATLTIHVTADWNQSHMSSCSVEYRYTWTKTAIFIAAQRYWAENTHVFLHVIP